MGVNALEVARRFEHHHAQGDVMSSLDAPVGLIGQRAMPDVTVVSNDVVRFLDFYAGVATLVALSIAVMLGVLAMDRILLQPRQRVQAQVLHRSTAVASLMFLFIHVTIRVLEGHVTPVDAAVPFLHGLRAIFVGLGTVAAYLMILLAATGLTRGRFAAGARPAVWRAIHSLAYVTWPIALAHGLQAGRAPKAWVGWSYVACIALVLIGLAVRAMTGRRMHQPGWQRGRVARPVPVPGRRGRRRRDRGPDMFIPRRIEPMREAKRLDPVRRPQRRR
jgi:DMSO/TMAO reductase YedYZ heme-binding membrane subunit